MTAATLTDVRHVLHAVKADRTTPATARGWLGRILVGLVPAASRDDALLVASELVSNSVLHGPAGGDVYLAAQVLGDAVELLVHDSGAPFNPAGRGLVIAEALATLTYDIRDGSTEIRALIPITKETAS
jgi:anti-sigma regulatory factor (Ser/Thr protein kinase)